jgi:uncharacterized protein YndB with AHSA1/START domain
MRRDIRIERFLRHPPERVWRALTEAPTLGRWFMPTEDFEPKLGHAFTFRMKPQRGWDGVTHCEVLELEPLRRIAYAYRGQATGEKTLACAGIHSPAVKRAGRGILTRLDTVLRFSLEAERTCSGEEETRLVLEHQGFEGFQLTLVGLVMDMGWRKVLKRLLPVLDGLGPAAKEAEGQAVALPRAPAYGPPPS